MSKLSSTLLPMRPSMSRPSLGRSTMATIDTGARGMIDEIATATETTVASGSASAETVAVIEVEGTPTLSRMWR